MQRCRRGVLDALVIGAALLLAGCVAAPDFEVPIQWGEGRLDSGTEAVPERVDAVVALFADGEAWLSGFPQGVTVEQDDGTLCLDTTTAEGYVGAASWSARSDHRVELTFGESTVNVFDGGGRFGSQDWTEARIVECGEPGKTWRLSLTCGDPGFDLPDDVPWERCESR